MNNYSENLFAAIDTIIAERLNKLNFDRTGIYTIVSQYEKDKTKYWVTDGSIRFLATASEGALYHNNQQVYVTIPQNNYEGDKVILGVYSSTDTTKNTQTYVDPYSRFVASQQVLEQSDFQSISVTVNAPIEEIDHSLSDISTLYTPSQTYDYIGVTFSFDANIQGYNGSYAIIFELVDQQGQVLNTTSSNDLDHNNLIISSRQLSGNPYNLVSNLVYNVILPYPKHINPSDIDAIDVILAQDGKFDQQNRDTQITLTSLGMAFGYDKEKLKVNTTVLAVGANETLKYTDYDETKTRTLNLDWIYQDSKTKEFSIFNQYNTPTNIFEEYTIYWLHYVDGAGENKDLSNEYNWVTLATNTNFSYLITLDTALKTDQYKAVIKYKLKPAVEGKEKEDTTVKKEEYLFTEAEGLIFESTQLRAEPGAANASGDTIRFSFLDNCNGTFNYYGLDDRMSETSRGSGPYTIVANFLDSTKWDIGDSNSRIEKVEWITPTINTMINTDKDIVISDNKKELSFYIKTIYLHEATNNRIECIVTFKNGEIRRGSINLQFGQNQTNGTTYAFNIDFVGSQNCLYLAGNAASEIQVQASFTKSNGDPVSTPPITWSWVHLNEDGENDSHITITPVTNNIVTLSYNQTNFPEQLTLNDETQQANFSILQATIENYNAENGVSVDLKAYLPIPLATKDYTHISGATRIVYDTLGNSVSFSRNPYALYKGNAEETNTVYWKCIAGPGATEGVPEIRTMNVEEKLQHTLKPISYCPPEIPMACIAAYLQTGVKEQENEEGETIETPETELVWLQPLLIVQNSWNSDMINDWDGAVEIDTEKGNIKSPIFMAGKKTDNNLFTGVVLGDVQRASVGDAVGLYGFQDSQLRYRLDENGAFYVGSTDKAGKESFISFNENVEGRSGENELVIKTNNFMLDVKDDEGDIVLYLSNAINNNQAWLQFEDKLFLGPTKAEIVGWQMARTSGGSYFYSEDKNGTFSVLKSAGDVCFAVGAPSHIGTTGAKLQISHNGTLRAGRLDGLEDNNGANNTYALVVKGEQDTNDNETAVFIYAPTQFYATQIGREYDAVSDLKIETAHFEPYEIRGETFNNTFLIIREDYRLYSKQCNFKAFTSVDAIVRSAICSKPYAGELEEGREVPQISLRIGIQRQDKNGEFQWNSEDQNFNCARIRFIANSNNPNGIGNLYGNWNLPDSGSDIRIKHDVEDLSIAYEILFDHLQPKRFKYNYGTSDRYHTGFVAQEVLDALQVAGLSTKDFAAPYLSVIETADETMEECWYLRKEEIIALNTNEIQKLKTRVTQLEQEIKELKHEI